MSQTPAPQTGAAKPVLLTGANGFVGAWIARRLLEEGHTVHATVRDVNDTRKTAHLKALADQLPGTLRLFAADLTTPSAYDEAMQGCGIVIHSAARFTTHSRDPMQDFVIPAIEGTKNVLASVNRTETVARVVMTSSCAAIYGDAADVTEAPGGILTEEVWNKTSSADHQPYSYSKLESERIAWEIAGAQSRWRLVTINPSLVMGPALSDAPDSGSFEYLQNFVNGTLKTGAPALYVGMVDVRDVADAHIRAGFLPDAEGRYILSESGYSLMDTARIISRHFKGHSLPPFEIPSPLARLIAPLMSRLITRRFAQRNFGHRWAADNSKSRRDLGIEYRPVEAAIVEMFAQMTGEEPIRN